MPFFRKWKQIFGQKCDFLDVDAQLTGTRTKKRAFDRDNVAQVGLSIRLEAFRAELFSLGVDL